MKRILLACALLFISTSAIAASSATTTPAKLTQSTGKVSTVVVDWIADTDGSFSDYTVSGICGLIMHVSTAPGSPAPTTLYDVQLRDNYEVDVMGNALADRSASATEQTLPYIGGGYYYRYACGDMTLAISNNAVASAAGKVIIYVAH